MGKTKSDVEHRVKCITKHQTQASGCLSNRWRSETHVHGIWCLYLYLRTVWNNSGFICAPKMMNKWINKWFLDTQFNSFPANRVGYGFSLTRSFSLHCMRNTLFSEFFEPNCVALWETKNSLLNQGSALARQIIVSLASWRFDSY